MSIIRDLFTPEAQRGGHYWSAVAASHCYLGLGLWGGIAVIWDRWTGVYAAPILYLVIIEGLQLLLAPRRTRHLLWDSIFDAVAVALGCIAAAFVGDQNLNGAMAAWCASIAMILIGWRLRNA